MTLGNPHHSILFALALSGAFALGACSDPIPGPEEPEALETPTLHDPSLVGQSTAPDLPLSANHEIVTVTDSGGILITRVTFEGGDNVASIHPENGNLIPGSNMRFPGWLTLIDSDAGGTGNFANEPSPSTVIFFLGDLPLITFDEPVCGVRLHYSASTTVSLEVRDADDNTVESTTGPANHDTGPGGDPNGSFTGWDPLTLDVCSGPGNVISTLVFTAGANQSAIDDLTALRLDHEEKRERDGDQDGDDEGGDENDRYREKERGGDQDEGDEGGDENDGFGEKERDGHQDEDDEGGDEGGKGG
jgi:hypothetical protein